MLSFVKILWHVALLVDNVREISNYTCTTAASRERPVNSNKETTFSVRSVPRFYKQDQLRSFAGSQCVS
jgi:hypothetical protein